MINKIKIVASFEYMAMVKNKAFLTITAILILISVATALLPTIISFFRDSFGSDASTNTGKIAFIDDTGIFEKELLDSYFPNYDWILHDASQLEYVVENIQLGDILMALHFTDELSYDVFFRDSLNTALLHSFDDMLRTVYQRNNLLNEGISLDKINEIIYVDVTSVPVDISTGNSLIGLIAIIMIYSVIIFYGNTITMSVVNEKTSKTIELILTSGNPLYTVFGKVIGINLAALTQIGSLIAAFIIALFISENSLINDISSQTLYMLSDPYTYIYVIIFTLSAFITYSFLFVACGSMVKDIQDASNATPIPIILSIAALYIGMFSLNNPLGTLATVTSFVPFLSPIVMIARITSSTIPVYQILIAILVNIASIIIVGTISARIYKICIMMYGTKASFKFIISKLIRD